WRAVCGGGGPCVVGGSFVRTPAFAALLAALREGGGVLAAEEVAGTTAGAVVLARWPGAIEQRPPAPVRAAEIEGLDAYRRRQSSTAITRPGKSRTGPSSPEGSKGESRP